MNTQTRPSRPGTLRPRTDVIETAEALILVADLCGVDETSLELSLSDDVLTLRAKPVTSAPQDWQPVWAEFELPDAYERSFRLAAEIDREDIGATIQKGRLRVTLKKRQPRSSRIPVRAS